MCNKQVIQILNILKYHKYEKKVMQEVRRLNDFKHKLKSWGKEQQKKRRGKVRAIRT